MLRDVKELIEFDKLNSKLTGKLSYCWSISNAYRYTLPINYVDNVCNINELEIIDSDMEIIKNFFGNITLIDKDFKGDNYSYVFTVPLITKFSIPI